MPFAGSLPTTLNFSVPGIGGKELLDLFDAAALRVSAGSACAAARAAPSYVLEAMGLPAWRCGAAVRMSFGPMAGQALIDAACERIRRCGEAWRACASLVRDGAAAGLEAGDMPDAAAADAGLAPDALAAFLLAHPDARLVDVRESFEHALGGVPAGQHGVEHVPLSRLPAQAAEWLLGQQRPLVFFCRSGKRSLQALHYLRRLGYRNAWHVAGGLALAA